jgi:hypothetical protein
VRRLLIALFIPVCLALTSHNAAAEWLTYEAVGTLTSLPTWSPAYEPGNDQVVFRWAWDTDAVYSQGPNSNTYSVPFSFEASVGGISVFPQSRVANWARATTGTTSNGSFYMLTEQTYPHLPGFPSDAGGGRWLTLLYISLAFEPGAPVASDFSAPLPLDALVSGRVGFWFANELGALGYNAVLTDVRQVPETGTLLALLPGLLFAGLCLRPSLTTPC